MKRISTQTEKNIRRRRNREGFTLIEVMVVLFILLSLAGASVVAVLNMYDSSRKKSAEVYVKTLATSCEYYKLHIGRFPTTEQGLDALLNPPSDLPDPGKWEGPYLKDNVQTLDPWGNPWQYAYPGTHTRDGCDVWSLGPDGMNETEDDIGNWKK